MNLSLPFKIAFGFVVTILLLVVVSYFYFSSTQAFIQSSAEVQNSQKIINQLEVVMSLIKDAETGQRGFIITENETFLDPYFTASENLESQLLELSLLLRDSSQMQRYETLVPDISSMMARLDFSIDLIKRNEFDSAISYIVSTTGKRYMDKIRSNVQVMREAEKGRLNTLAEKAQTNTRNTFMAVLGGATLTSLFLILGLLGIFSEISKKKRVESDLKSTNKELSQTQEKLKSANSELEKRVQERTRELTKSEERNRSLIEATTSIVWNANHEGKIIEEVPLWEAYTGQSLRQYMDYGWMNAFHPEDRKAIKSMWAEASDKKKNLVTESRLRNGSGEYRHVLLYGVPIFNPEGIVEEWIGTISDIHDRKTAAEALVGQKMEVESAYQKAEISNTKLKNVNKVLETFVYAAAHDLKSPIINLKSLLDFIHQTPELDKKFELMQRFEEAVIRLDNTISGLGEIIEVQEADNSIVKPIYFQDILDQVKAEYEYKIIESNAKIETDFNQTPSMVYLESYLNSVITNMVTNALKYYKEEVPLLLQISSKKVEDTVILTFKDNGIGMDLNRYGSNLFKPFKRFTTKAEGKGIGLHIIKNMIEKNGGHIEVESEPGEGTTFRCFLKEYEMPS